MNISLRTRLPRRLGYKIIAAGLVVAPLLFSSGSAQAGTPAVAALQGLTTGSSGESVKALQEALIARGIAVVGGADGHFGPKTLAALNEFQRSVGLEVTNSVDEATAIAVGTAISPLTGLAVGSTGESVKTLQEALIGAGHTPKGGADGRFGPATEAALRAFQNAAGLPVTGVADEITVARLGAVTNAPVAPSPAEESNSAPAEPAPALAPEASGLIGVRYGAVSAARGFRRRAGLHPLLGRAPALR